MWGEFLIIELGTISLSILNVILINYLFSLIQERDFSKEMALRGMIPAIVAGILIGSDLAVRLQPCFENTF